MAPYMTSIVLGIAVALSGCAFEGGEGDESLSHTESALGSDNALNLNALNLNALNLDALNLDALSLNALSPESLDAIQDPGPRGELARELVRYAASCALQRGQSFDFTWTERVGKQDRDEEDEDGEDEEDGDKVDGEVIVHHESYPGLLGLAPGWAEGPLDEQGQRMVSACLAARVNYHGVAVMISARSPREPLKHLSSREELAAYPNVEGAFWGNLFTDKPYVNTCFNAETVNNSRARKRECATGHKTKKGHIRECGMLEIVGPCDLYCQPLDEGGQYYPSCFDQPWRTNEVTQDVITTALP